MLPWAYFNRRWKNKAGEIQVWPLAGPNGPSMPDGFLLIGEEFYVIDMGASLFLKSYCEPVKTYWQITNIGGNINDVRFLNRELIAVSYGFNNIKEEKFMYHLLLSIGDQGELITGENEDVGTMFPPKIWQKWRAKRLG